LVGALGNEAVGGLKQRLNVAAACAQVIEEGVAKTQAAALIAFVVSVIHNCSENELFRASGPILLFKELFDRDSANDVFVVLLSRLLETRDDSRAAAFSRTLKKLLKRYPIEDEYVQRFVNAVLEARVQVFWGNTPNRISDLVSPIFALLAQVVKKTPSKGGPIVARVLDWLDNRAYGPVPLFLPLGAALSVGGFNADLPPGSRRLRRRRCRTARRTMRRRSASWRRCCGRCSQSSRRRSSRWSISCRRLFR
jgi:hypothetical protein